MGTTTDRAEPVEHRQARARRRSCRRWLRRPTVSAQVERPGRPASATGQRVEPDSTSGVRLHHRVGSSHRRTASRRRGGRAAASRVQQLRRCGRLRRGRTHADVDVGARRCPADDVASGCRRATHADVDGRARRRVGQRQCSREHRARAISVDRAGSGRPGPGRRGPRRRVSGHGRRARRPCAPVFSAPSALASNTSVAAAPAQASLDQRSRGRAADLLVAAQQQAQRRMRQPRRRATARTAQTAWTRPAFMSNTPGPLITVALDLDRPARRGCLRGHTVS